MTEQTVQRAPTLGELLGMMSVFMSFHNKVMAKVVESIGRVGYYCTFPPIGSRQLKQGDSQLAEMKYPWRFEVQENAHRGYDKVILVSTDVLDTSTSR